MVDKKEELKVTIWPSNRIKEAYYEKNYYKNCGTLGNSCMRHKSMQKALNFYILNKVKIAVVLERGKIAARALFWEDIKTFGGKKIIYLDRVYYCAEGYRKCYREFVENNKYYSFDWNHSDLYKDNINLTGITHLPYADTMRYLFYKDKILMSKPDTKNKKLKEPDKVVTLSTTADYGYCRALDKNSVREAISDRWCSKKDCIFIKKYDGYVQKNHIIDVNGEYYSIYDRKNIIQLESGQYAHKDFIVIELYSNRKISKLEATYIKINSDEEGYVNNNNIVVVNGKQYSKHSPNIVECKDDNHYYLKSQCYYYEGEYLPKHLTAIIYTLNENDNNEVVIDQEKYIYASQLSEHIELYSGMFIDKRYKSFIVKYNGKYYLKNKFRKNDTKQKYLFGLTPSKAPLECL